MIIRKAFFWISIFVGSGGGVIFYAALKNFVDFCRTEELIEDSRNRKGFDQGSTFASLVVLPKRFKFLTTND